MIFGYTALKGGGFSWFIIFSAGSSGNNFVSSSLIRFWNPIKSGSACKLSKICMSTGSISSPSSYSYSSLSDSSDDRLYFFFFLGFSSGFLLYLPSSLSWS